MQVIDFTQARIVLPCVEYERDILPAIGAYASIPEVHTDATSLIGGTINGESLSTISTPRDISGMLNQWFFGGLQYLRFNLKPGRVVGTDKEFAAFVGTILGSFEPKHEHKMAFLNWCICECCESVTYQKKA